MFGLPRIFVVRSLITTAEQALSEGIASRKVLLEAINLARFISNVFLTTLIEAVTIYDKR